jgi:uncharacterized lipoprotein YajG
MSFSNTACDNDETMRSLVVLAMLLLLAAGCASPMQDEQVQPAAVLRHGGDDPMASVKPATPPAVTRPSAPAERASSSATEVHDDFRIDSANIESK